MSREMEYIKKENSTEKVIRTELLLTPLLVFLPLFVGILFIYDWYGRGIINNNSEYFGTLMIGIVILIGNLLFDIPFIKSLRKLTKSKKSK
jgi:hypothetical protein